MYNYVIWALKSDSSHSSHEYQCNKCSGDFTGKDSVERHKRHHSDKKKTCPCGNGFVSGSNVRRHQVSKHALLPVVRQYWLRNIRKILDVPGGPLDFEPSIRDFALASGTPLSYQLHLRYSSTQEHFLLQLIPPLSLNYLLMLYNSLCLSFNHTRLHWSWEPDFRFCPCEGGCQRSYPLFTPLSGPLFPYSLNWVTLYGSSVHH